MQMLRLNPMRSILSTLGVIIGVASLVAVLSLGDGMERTARTRLSETTDLQTLAIESRMREEIDGQFFPLSDTVALTQRDLAGIRALGGVEQAALVSRAPLEVRSTDSSRRRMAGATIATPGYERMARVDLAAGRHLREGDSAVVVISARLAQDFASDTSEADAARLLGTTLLVGATRTTVIGVLRGEMGVTSRSLIIPLTGDSTVRAAAHYPTLVVRTRRVEDVRSVEQGVRRYLVATLANPEAAFAVQTYRARAEQASQGILIFKLVMGAITGISLIVGGIGIMNVLLASVSERTREIGIRRAAGARRRDIAWQFLAEAVTISGVGALIGVVAGLVGAFAITGTIRSVARAAFVEASFSWSSLLISAALSIAIGLLFGTYPARRAANLSPIEAIRHE